MGIKILGQMEADHGRGPVMLLAALAIGLESRFRAPVLYRPIRVGQHDRSFTILKFRTMRVDAEREGARLAEPDDPHITRVGRLPRETRIDELPQWVNVPRGEMSLVAQVRHFEREKLGIFHYNQ